MRSRLLKSLVPLAVLPLIVGGCSDDGSDTSVPAVTSTTAQGGAGAAATGSTKPGQRGPVVSGDFSFDGALDLAGKYSVSYPLKDDHLGKCDEIVKPGAGYVVPAPSFSGDMRFVWAAAVTKYRGAGTYGLADFRPFSIDVRRTPDAAPERFAAGEGTTVALDVNEVNSGSFKFSGLKSPAGGELSGSLIWSCT